MFINLSCQIRFALSILTIICGPSAQANPLAQCPAIKLAYACEDTIPTLVITRPQRGKDLTFRLGALNANGPLGDRIITLPPGTPSTRVSLAHAPSSVLRLAIIGTDLNAAKGGPDTCCLRQATLPLPTPGDPAEICNPPPPDESTAPSAAHTPPQTNDIGIELQLDDICPIGPQGHTCSGTLEFTVAGTPKGPFPLTLDYAPFDTVSVDINGPLQCYHTGEMSQMCRDDAAILDKGLTVPISLTAPSSFQNRTVKVCAALALPKDETQTIMLVQTALGQLGFDAGTPDGHNGPKTRAALKDLSNRFGLEIQGPTDPAFLQILGLKPYQDEFEANNKYCATTVFPARPRPTITKPSVDKPEIINPETELPRPHLNISIRPNLPDVMPKMVCDRESTVARAGRCACRFSNMTQVSKTRCQCKDSSAPSDQGCLK